MKDSERRISFIADYISAYEAKINLLNKQGLFDSAKLFELFAIEVGTLYFGQKLYNLNVKTFTYPSVDLISEDKTFYVQVSTASDIPNKVKKTLESIRDSEKPEIKAIKNVKFIVLNNDSSTKVKDLIGTNRVGSIEFVKKRDLITTKDIINKASNDFQFQLSLYELLLKEQTCIQNSLAKWCEAIENSKILIRNIDCKINNEYEIDRTEIIGQIKSDNNKNISIQGNAGSGKSVLCKKFVESESCVIYARAERFLEETDINNVWGFNIRETLYCLKEKSIIFFIDSLESIADNKTKLDLLSILYDATKDYSAVKIITSCRTSDKNAFIKLEGTYNISTYEVPDLSFEQQREIAQKYTIVGQMMRIESYKDLLKSPLYLNLIITQIPDLNSIEDENEFREYVWESIICLKNSQIKDTINNIVFERARTSAVGVSIDNYDQHIIKKLISEGIVIKNSNTVRLKYDVFEDICFEQYFNREFDKCRGDYKAFFDQVESLGRCAYRRFQIWIENKLFAKTNREKFLHELIFSDKMPAAWKRQTQIGLVKSRHSESFFNDYGNSIIANNLLEEFVKVTNLYAFAIESNLLPDYIITLKPNGIGRKSLIHLIAVYDWFRNNHDSFRTISKLCSDYVAISNIDQDTAKECLKILSYILDYYCGKSQQLKSHIASEFINELLKSIYKIAQYAKAFIKNFWDRVVNWYKSGESNAVSFSREILEYTLKFEHVSLAKYMPKELCAIAEFFWTFTPEIKGIPFPLYHQDYDKLLFQYGLSVAAENYEHDTNKSPLFGNNFFFTLFRTNFWIGLQWTIKFINEAVATLVKNCDNNVPNYCIVFNDGESRNYYGYDKMWIATVQEYSMPLLISDLLYCLKYEIKDIVSTVFDDDTRMVTFANKAKEIIYKQSNNIALLTIIAEIGMEFEDKLPGYALDLDSNIYLILHDLSRTALLIKSPIKEQLEKQMLLSIGLPFPLEKRYTSTSTQTNLLNYFIKMICCGDKSIKQRCIDILDYLYSVIPNDEEHATEYLQLEKMDIRKAQFKMVDDTHVAIEPTITGAAKDLVERQESVSRPESDFAILINEWNKKFESKDFNTKELVGAIDNIRNIMKKSFAPFSYEKNLIALICCALSQGDLEQKHREEYCQYWIDGIYRIMNNTGSFIFDNNFVSILVIQIEKDINLSVKNKIKKLVLDCLLYCGPNGVIFTIANFMRKCLFQNNNLSKAIFNTIVKLSEDEMEHEEFNAQYLISHSKEDSDYAFVPNMRPKLIGVDKVIENNGDLGFISKKDNIINEYLYNESSLNVSDFEMEKHDIALMSYALNCREDVIERDFSNIVKKYLLALIEMYQQTSKSYSSHQILDVYHINEVKDLLKRALISYPTQTEIILSIMFDEINFNTFCHETVDFYQDVFSVLLPYYFNSHNDKEARAACQNIIYMLEKKILTINMPSVRVSLFKSIILSLPRLGGFSDWSKKSAFYSYLDKQFLNEMFSKYGGYHLDDLLDVIYKLHYDKLLPEILISLNKTFQTYIARFSKNSFTNIINERKAIVLLIITRAFLDFNKQIKEDKDLTDSFEAILEVLRDIDYPEAAVILDEFRIH